MKIMFEVRALSYLFSWFFLMNLAFAAKPIGKPGCSTRCGNITVPYPFGIGLDGRCSLDNYYNINCNTSYDPPIPFLGKSNLEVVHISNSQVRVKTFFAAHCYQSGKLLASPLEAVWMSLNNLPLVFSDTANKFTVIGCDDVSVIKALSILGLSFTSGCVAVCSKPQEVINGSCSGTGCCQTSIPKGLKAFAINSTSISNHSNVSLFNPCSYAFLAEHEKLNFNVADLSDLEYLNRTRNNVPVVLEWVIGENQTCFQARRNRSTYACQQNTNCTDFDAVIGGYHCSCLPGYDGNPYLSPGCTDIDECASRLTNPCSHICTNTLGSYNCSCPHGYRGDGLANGTSCNSYQSPQFIMRFTLGMSFGFLFLLILVSWVYFTIRRKKLIRMREKFFEQNGGLLLKQQLSQVRGATESSTIYSAEELKVATNNYSEDRILGQGGYGTVYLGTLKNGHDVAIKKSKVADHSQVEQFINEVVILTQINHRNVVKLLGCCLESEVPLLVYEFISNGTLFDHIHRSKSGSSWLTWDNCIRLAAEAADALAYLHSAASVPIIHRDVKSTNILLDEHYTAKISDFGASRLVPIDQTRVTTLVQGTLGYLDPEYFHTSHLTEKSDVYSFGVVLAELLTKEKPLSLDRKMEERNLATYFVLSMKENRLKDIIDPDLVSEANEEQLATIAKLVRECLNVEREDRPTMKEVAVKLEKLKQNKHPLSNQKKHKQTTDIIDQDLYPLPWNSNSGDDSESSEQYSMQIALVSEMSHPR